MNNKSHFICSLAKSAIRIAGCLLLLLKFDFLTFGLTFLVAEALGVVEEMVDNR